VPQWTVICPTYNRGPAIERTIRSVIGQDLRDWELIVASDGSVDDTDEVVRALADEDARVRLIRTQHFGFPSGPCNAAIAEAGSELIAYVGHDDELHPQHLSVLTDAMTGDVDVVYTRADTIDASGRRIGRTDPLQQYWHPELQLMSALFEPARAGYRRRAIEEAGGWRETPGGLEDWDLWLRFSDDGRRFQPVEDVSVALLRDDTTRQHTLRGDHHVELARFPTPSAARGAYRALTDRRRLGDILDGYRRDAVAWYRSLWTSGELVCPPGWAGDEDRMLAALHDALQAEADPWQTTQPASYGDRHVIENVIATQTPEQATRVGACFARTMPGFMTLFTAAIERFDGELTVLDDTPVAGGLG